MAKNLTARQPVLKSETGKTEERANASTDAQKKTLERMHVVVEHWRSDLMFFKDEVDFFRKLIEKHFLWLIDGKHINVSQTLLAGLGKFEKRRFSITEKLNEHTRHLAGLSENFFIYNGKECKREHDQLEEAMSEFTKDFRGIKQEAFTLAEKAINSAKARHLLTGGR